MNFDYTTNYKSHPQAMPVYPSPNGSAHFQADGNIQYLKLIDMIGFLWNKSHPDVEFVPSNSTGISDPDKGYIVYGLESRATTKEFSKPRFMEMIRDTQSGKDIAVWMQSFDNFISFMSVHKDPRVSEEIIEEFEDFMVWSQAILKQLGAAELLYSRRYPDREDRRIGQDMCVRTVVYRVFLQRIVQMEYERLEAITIEIRNWVAQTPAPEPDDYGTISVNIINDNAATPSFES